MKQLSYGVLLALCCCTTLWAQNDSKQVELKEVTDGKFRQVTAVGEMRSLPDGNYYTAMNPERTMIVKYAYKTGEPVDTLFNTHTARECTFDDFEGYTISSTATTSWCGARRRPSTVVHARRSSMIMTSAGTMSSH